MKVYLAGAISGNLAGFWSGLARREDATSWKAIDEEMKIFLAGMGGRWWILDEPVEKKKEQEGLTGWKERISLDMRLYLAGVAPWRNEGEYDPTIKEYAPYILESFYYADKDTERLLPHFGDFLLDSGAFSFMSGVSAPNWDEYVERYADFIKRNKVEKYFELDVDSVVGYEKVKGFRGRLERLTGVQCIPVWHKSRGVAEFKNMCDEYKYVAIGGIVSKEIKPAQYEAFPPLIREAHKRGAKVHGLGFTNLSALNWCKFDSVDSTAWTTGNRFGHVYVFDGKTMKKVSAPAGYRLGNPREVAVNNFIEWVKFQKYAETHL